MTTKKVSQLNKKRPKESDPFDFIGAVEEGKKLSKKQKEEILKNFVYWPDSPELINTFVKAGIITSQQAKKLKVS